MSQASGNISYFRQKGDPYVLMTSLALLLTLGMVVLMFGIILFQGLGFFWPRDLQEITLKQGEIYLGEIWEEETVHFKNSQGRLISESEIQIKKGNRDLSGRDFIWFKKQDISDQKSPPLATAFERMEYGNFYGYITGLNLGDKFIEDSAGNLFQQSSKALEKAMANREKREDLENQLNQLLAPLAGLQREISLLEIDHSIEPEAQAKKIDQLRMELQNLERKIEPDYQKYSGLLQKVADENEQLFLLVQTAEGAEVHLPLEKVVRLYQPNRMNIFQKTGFYAGKLWEFIAADPRESNTEGGVFPAIFGTVMMVLLMSIAVVPVGVLAALYLNEYAHQGTIIRLIRLSVNNLAGVPSIVFGIFGLGFFIYIMGSSIDQLFFSNKLPEPTFGTGGILWASLTLALLTLPVVVVATEEGILAVPRANKEGALALGATRWQMIRKIVLPNAMPGILTGLILAISRGAGEVAPLMITGVVKLAPSLPIDASFPFLHLDRKFMHLGFHIYDVGFQSPNVEAAKPMVYTTALLLILIVIFLNLLAIYMRNRLRKKYKTAVF
ncbi:MAG: phosphate ABC transporter, permease protein PstA [Caldithrix sp. RBG_13_44_9]|nr:MAG: phosphate ABC transporter, permease protein PstA [Caldithrix sp. RBG_13_44_9]